MRKSILAALAVATASATPVAVPAQPSGEQVRESFKQVIPNVPGKSLVAVEVTYSPGGASPAHRHAPSAFIYARVLSGRVESALGDAPARIYGPGESFFETPGSHHRVSRNASTTEPATLLAIFVVDTGDAPLTVPEGTKASP